MRSIPLTSWLNKKVVEPFLHILHRGAEPKLLAFSAALGITLGVFPICGVTVFLCGFAIALLGTICHAPTVMLANFVATPVELSLVVPFLRFGEVISGGNHFPLSSDALKKVLTGQASREILLSIFHALLGWLVASPFILGALYLFFLPLFKYMVYKFGVIPSSPSRLSHGHSVHSHPEIKVKVGGMDCVNEPLTCIMNLIMRSAFSNFSSFEFVMEFISFCCQSSMRLLLGCMLLSVLKTESRGNLTDRYYEVKSAIGETKIPLSTTSEVKPWRMEF